MTIGLYELLTILFSILAYSTAAGYFFYQLNEKSIKELDKRMDERMDKSETHWREMFMYFNSQLQESKKDRKR